MKKNNVEFLNRLACFAPGFAARMIERRWFATQRPGDFSAQLAQLKQNSHEIITTRTISGIPLYRWPANGQQTLLCVHGWSGWGGQFAAFASNMCREGISVEAFDGPGHGCSRGHHSHLFALRDALLDVARSRPAYDAIICHSYGLAVVLAAIEAGLEVRQLVSISAPARLYPAVEQYLTRMAVSDRLRAHFEARIKHRFGDGWWVINAPENRIAGCQIPGLIIHDELDRVVPVADGERLARAWPGAERFFTRGLGHGRILSSPLVHSTIVNYLREQQVKQ